MALLGVYGRKIRSLGNLMFLLLLLIAQTILFFYCARKIFFSYF